MTEEVYLQIPQYIRADAVKISVDVPVGIPQHPESQLVQISVPRTIRSKAGGLKMLGAVQFDHKPCVAFSNYNHKVAGTYDWIKHLPYIRFINEVSELEGAVKDVLSAKSLEFDNTRIKEEYAGLKKKLGR